MPIEQTSGLPFSDDFPVHTQIRIQPAGREYEAYVQSDWAQWHRFHIRLKEQDVEELNSTLQQAVQKVATCFDKDAIASVNNNEALSELAQKGNFVFRRVFSEGLPRETISKALRPGSIIQASSEDFFIPWELLYDGPLGNDQVDVTRFWGLQYIISRTLIQDARPGDFVSPTIHSSRPRVGMITYDQLPYVVNQEIPALKRLHQQGNIYLSFLQPLHMDNPNEGLDKLGKFLGRDFQVAHLACHAYAKKPPSQSYLLISDTFPITIENFRVKEFIIKHKPFVILNACLTGTMSPLHTSNWASVFWERGARGVLATEFRVPDWFASAFIEELYKHLLLGTPIGKGLLTTRLNFWEEQGNPLGLAYALYSSPSVRITR